MVPATLANPGRVALAAVSDSRLNVSNRPPRFAQFSKSFNKKAPGNRSSMALKRSMTVGLGEKEFLGSQVHLTPRQEKARVLKMRLQLAYFKVKTNQTDVPLHRLKLRQGEENEAEDKDRTIVVDDSHPAEGAHIDETRTEAPDALSDLLAASSPLYRKSAPTIRVRKTRTRKRRKLVAGTTRRRDPVRRRSRHGKLDDVVTRRSSRSSASPALGVSGASSQNVCAQTIGGAPEHRMPFTLPTPYTHKSFSNQTSPSRFAMSRQNLAPALTRALPLAMPRTLGASLPTPLPTPLAGYRSQWPPIGGVASSVPPVTMTTRGTTNLDHASPVEAVDADATIAQNASIITTPSKPNTSASRTIDQDATVVQSPSRVLSTPSSMGAAQCLLQLARRK